MRMEDEIERESREEKRRDFEKPLSGGFLLILGV